MDLSSWIWPVAVAPFVGSFLGVVVKRFDAPRSIVFGRSMCPACGSRLQARDLLPLVSWIALRGRCRHCAAPIGAFYPLMELAALGCALWAAALFDGWALWASCLLGWTLLTLALIDIGHFLLPNFLTFPLVGAGLLANWTLDPAALLPDVIGAAAGLLFVVGLRYGYRILRGREGIGLGDAKLLAAAGAWVSWTGLSSVVLIAALLGLLVAVLQHWRDRAVALTDRLPFGAYLCCGLWIIWLHGPLQLGEGAMRLSRVGSIGAALLSPGTALAADPAPGDAANSCIDVRIGDDRSTYLNCLNEQIKRSAEHARGTPQPAAPIDAQSPSNQVGTANDAAAREKMGNAFGHSAVPQRPARPF